MDRGKRDSISRFFGGAGFYIALLLCILVVAVVGYFTLFRSPGLPVETVEDPISDSRPQGTATGLPATVDGPAEQPFAEVSQPAQVLMPEEETAPVADVLPTPPPAQPVMAEPPVVVVKPLAGQVVATFSGDELVYNETTADWRTHGGMDITASAGTAVAAACAGTVLSVEEDPRLGVMVTIGHSGGYETTYASLQETVHVSEGDRVTAGQVIGAVGNTTLTESGLGAHLHFAVTLDGEAIDPEEYLAQG